MQDAAAVADEGWTRLLLALDSGDMPGLAESALRLRSALAAAPDHPDRACWHYGLGLAMAVTAENTEALVDWEQAHDALSRAWREPHPAVGRDELAADLGLVILGRFLAAGSPAAALDRLVEDLDELVTPDDPVHSVALLRGLARLQRYDAQGDSRDREAGLALLTRTLSTAPDDTPMAAEALIATAESLGMQDTTTALAALDRARQILGPDADRTPVDEL